MIDFAGEGTEKPELEQYEVINSDDEAGKKEEQIRPKFDDFSNPEQVVGFVPAQGPAK